jgi:hypothetical protein
VDHIHSHPRQVTVAAIQHLPAHQEVVAVHRQAAAAVVVVVVAEDVVNIS